ncbi:MAG TPA: adenosine deaminase, partial [Pedococcus sp.]|nr:adenosine deaminase [Pedococcus sp.]
LLFGSRLAAQYDLARDALGFTDAELARLALDSLAASRAPESLRKSAADDVADWLAAETD